MTKLWIVLRILRILTMLGRQEGIIYELFMNCFKETLFLTTLYYGNFVFDDAWSTLNGHTGLLLKYY